MRISSFKPLSSLVKIDRQQVLLASSQRWSLRTRTTSESFEHKRNHQYRDVERFHMGSWQPCFSSIQKWNSPLYSWCKFLSYLKRFRLCSVTTQCPRENALLILDQKKKYYACTSIMSSTKDCDWSHFQRTGRQLKVRRQAKHLNWRMSRCLEMRSNTVFSAWYILLIDTKTKTKRLRNEIVKLYAN